MHAILNFMRYLYKFVGLGSGSQEITSVPRYIEQKLEKFLPPMMLKVLLVEPDYPSNDAQGFLFLRYENKINRRKELYIMNIKQTGSMILQYRIRLSLPHLSTIIRRDANEYEKCKRIIMYQSKEMQDFRFCVFCLILGFSFLV